MELILTEGKDAASSVRQVCNRQSQYIFALQGKLPNAQKRSMQQLVGNVQVARLTAALELYDDACSTRFEKILLLCDPDIDGQHANALLGMLFMRLWPNLVSRGLVDIVQPPLYRLQIVDRTIDHFCYSEQQYQEQLAALQACGETVVTSYYKGLASMDAGVLYRTCVQCNSRLARRLTMRPYTEL